MFLKRRDGEPTNNESERALRPSVIFRKVTNGFRSEWGAKTYAALCSIVETGRRNVLGQLELAFVVLVAEKSDPEDVANLPLKAHSEGYLRNAPLLLLEVLTRARGAETPNRRKFEPNL